MFIRYKRLVRKPIKALTVAHKFVICLSSVYTICEYGCAGRGRRGRERRGSRRSRATPQQRAYVTSIQLQLSIARCKSLLAAQSFEQSFRTSAVFFFSETWDLKNLLWIFCQLWGLFFFVYLRPVDGKSRLGEWKGQYSARHAMNRWM